MFSVDSQSTPPTDVRPPLIHQVNMDSDVNPSIANFAPHETTESVKGNMKKSSSLFIPLCLMVIIGGAATGMGLGQLRAKTSSEPGTFQGEVVQKVAGENITAGQIFGSANETEFKDSAEGFLELGGLDGEGSHKLLRAGGISQTVYLTSSVTDLSKFEGMKIKVWGETFKGQKAGWLMDVGRVQVIDTAAQAPFTDKATQGKQAPAAGNEE